MKVLITGTAGGIGRECALLFLRNGHSVCGLDVRGSTIDDPGGQYTHFTADVSDPGSLPQIDGVEILVNNAGIQTPEKLLDWSGKDIPQDIKVNLLGAISVTEKYALQPKIKSVLFNASASALTGNEFPAYAASKAGLVGYMRHMAIRLAGEYRATCNALCFGGVLTNLNDEIIKDRLLWEKIMDVTPLKRWTTAEQAAEWIYFMTAVNSTCTGQAIDVSSGERNCADLFVWKDERQ